MTLIYILAGIGALTVLALFIALLIAIFSGGSSGGGRISSGGLNYMKNYLDNNTHYGSF